MYKNIRDIYIYMCVCMHIYIYIERERERERPVEEHREEKQWHKRASIQSWRRGLLNNRIRIVKRCESSTQKLALKTPFAVIFVMRLWMFFLGFH